MSKEHMTKKKKKSATGWDRTHEGIFSLMFKFILYTKLSFPETVVVKHSNML